MSKRFALSPLLAKLGRTQEVVAEWTWANNSGTAGADVDVALGVAMDPARTLLWPHWQEIAHTGGGVGTWAGRLTSAGNFRLHHICNAAGGDCVVRLTALELPPGLGRLQNIDQTQNSILPINLAAYLAWVVGGKIDSSAARDLPGIRLTAADAVEWMTGYDYSGDSDFRAQVFDW